MGTRDNIVLAADALFYEQGYEHTSFAAIADAVQISRGNFYHHFKTKDDILEAVIAARQERTREMLAQWEDEGGDPRERIERFIDILVRNQSKIMRHGCPVGTLCMELAKLGHEAQSGANAIMDLFRAWLREQFTQMGCKKEADAHALHLLARSQGVATLAQALRDKAFVQEEVRQMKAWVLSCVPVARGRAR
jgi:TetR/AcrR family transcriptional repressor of nem operon